jgi:hypothetical protein
VKGPPSSKDKAALKGWPVFFSLYAATPTDDSGKWRHFPESSVGVASYSQKKTGRPFDGLSSTGDPSLIDILCTQCCYMFHYIQYLSRIILSLTKGKNEKKFRAISMQ